MDDHNCWHLVLLIRIIFLCCILYREGESEETDFRTDENNDAVKGPSFPVAGVGSIILGIILAVMPNTFITWVVYILLPCSFLVL